MKLRNITSVGLMLSAAAVFALNGCRDNDTDTDFTAKTCAVDFNNMEVIDYPYQPEGLPVDLNGSGLTGLAFNSTGTTAYVTTSDAHGENTLLVIDTESGAVTVTDGNLSSESMDIQDLAIHPATGTIFGPRSWEGRHLYTITPTGDATLVDDDLPNHGGATNIAFGTDGTFYLLSGHTLYAIANFDTPDESVTTIQISETIFMMGLGFNAHDGLLYAASSETWGDIYTIDPADGTTIYVGSVDCPNGEGSCALHDIDFDPTTGEMIGVMGGAEESIDPDDLVGAIVGWSCAVEGDR